MIEKICPECNGARLKTQRLQITVNGKNIDQLNRMQLPELLDFLQALSFEEDIKDVASSIIREISYKTRALD